jgi:hypothetical protein
VGVSDLGGVGHGDLAAAGSQRHLQLYINLDAEALDARLRKSFPELSSASFDWRSPLASDAYREYWDRGFLEAVDQGQNAHALAQFWPRGGPHWDGLAVIARSGRPRGILLVEAKAHVSELLAGSPIGASVADSSRRQIEHALAWTQGNMGICGRGATSWCDTPLYQSANRLAHLQWLNCRGIDTWLVHVLFTGDDHVKAATESDWHEAVAQADAELGLVSGAADRAGHVMLPVIPT